jgi:hypothetical protein
MSSNTETGRLFQRHCQIALERLVGRKFELEVPITVGNRTHLYDTATAEQDIVCECKAFTWTASGNVPSAKIFTLREATAHLRALPEGTTRYLIMKRSPHPKRGELLADYFARFRHNCRAAARRNCRRHNAAVECGADH